MKKPLLFIITIMSFWLGKAQIPVTDAAANAQLAALNSQLAALVSESVSTGVTEASNLTETISQGEIILSQFQELKKIQSELETVSGFVKSFKALDSAIKYSLDSFSLFGEITRKLRNLPEYKGVKLNRSIDILNTILKDNNAIIARLKKTLTNSGIKTDEGIRLNLIQDYVKEMRVNYKKLNDLNTLIDKYFPQTYDPLKH